MYIYTILILFTSIILTQDIFEGYTIYTPGGMSNDNVSLIIVFSDVISISSFNKVFKTPKDISWKFIEKISLKKESSIFGIFTGKYSPPSFAIPSKIAFLGCFYQGF